MPDYNQLQTDIVTWLDRADLTDIIPSIISLAEIRMSRNLRTTWLTKIETYFVTVGGETDFPLPRGYNGFRTVRMNTNPIRSLTYIQPEQLNNTNLENSASGLPSYYTIVGDRLRIAPAPAASQSIQVTHYFIPVELSSTNLTNEFTVNAYDMLLYSSLMESKLYIKDDARVSQWMLMQKESRDNIEKDDSKKRWGESALEMTSDYQTRSASIG